MPFIVIGYEKTAKKVDITRRFAIAIHASWAKCKRQQIIIASEIVADQYSGLY
jgi:hypothetical protein